jgi:RHS repeat-associated protein
MTYGFAGRSDTMHQARYYNPGIGKFIQADPLRYGAGLNLYDYCNNDPINHSDPTGLNSSATQVEEKPADDSGLDGDPSVYSNGAGNAELGGGDPVIGGNAGVLEASHYWVQPDYVAQSVPMTFARVLASGSSEEIEAFLEINQSQLSDELIASGRARIGFLRRTVSDILKTRRGSILRAELDEGSPSWDQIRQMTWEQVQSAKGTGWKTIRKLLTDSRFAK